MTHAIIYSLQLRVAQLLQIEEVRLKIILYPEDVVVALHQYFLVFYTV